MTHHRNTLPPGSWPRQGNVVCFRPGTVAHERGLRRGVVLRTFANVESFLSDPAWRQLGVSEEALEGLLEYVRTHINPELLDLDLPIVKVFPCAILPLGGVLIVWPDDLEVVAEEYDLTAN